MSIRDMQIKKQTKQLESMLIKIEAFLQGIWDRVKPRAIPVRIGTVTKQALSKWGYLSGD